MLAQVAYRSHKPISQKLAQAKYDMKRLARFKGLVLVENGKDPETGAYVFDAEFSSFLAHTRSILQYAHKEAKARGMQSAYEADVVKRPILKLFKTQRDTDTHEYVARVRTTVSCTVELIKNRTPRETTPAKMPPAVVAHEILRRLEATPQLLADLQSDGRNDLVEAGRREEPLHEVVEFKDERDLFKLCETYLEAIKRFIDAGMQAGFIS